MSTMTNADDEDPSDLVEIDGVKYSMNREAHPWTGAEASLFVDSNVIDELYTPHDLEMATKTQKHTRGLFSPEQRRLWGRGSLWFAAALDASAVISVSLAREPFRFALRKAAPMTWGGGWVAAWLYFVKDAVFPDWEAIALHNHRGGNTANDTMIAEICKRRDIPLITRDKGLIKKAKARGVLVQSPEDYACTRMPLERARLQFFERFDQSALGYCIGRGDRPSILPFDECKVTATALSTMRGIYDYIWSDVSDAWVPNEDPYFFIREPASLDD